MDYVSRRDSHDASESYGIQVTNLTKEFKKKRRRWAFSFQKKQNEEKKTSEKTGGVTMALDHVNLNIRFGEIFGLLGPNGAGKTTLVKCLSTILIPDEGSAIVNGFDILRQPTLVRASIGIVTGGERSLYWKLTARDNLTYFAALYKLPPKLAKERINELLALIGLEDRADERLENYSTGMRQKIAIARALLHDPPILLLDEPTLGFDPTFSRQIREMIRDLCRRRGKTVLLTTHYMEEADELCDRIAIIDDGRIMAVDTPNALKEMVKETQLVEIACFSPPPDVEEYLRQLCPDVDLISLVAGRESVNEPDRIKLMGGSAEKYTSTVVDALRERKARIVSLQINQPTLEDVFIKLTGGKLVSEGGT